MGDALVGSATPDVIIDPGPGSPNRLLYSLGKAPAGPPAPPEPSPEPPPAPEPPPEPTPPPAPAPIGCASLPEQFTGSFTATGGQSYYASGDGFTADAGTHQGCLDGPEGVDFDLALELWNGLAWVGVAYSQSFDPDESITYDGSAGTYRWRAYSYSGTGSYTFGMQRP